MLFYSTTTTFTMTAEDTIVVGTQNVESTTIVAGTVRAIAPHIAAGGPSQITSESVVVPPDFYYFMESGTTGESRKRANPTSLVYA